MNILIAVFSQTGNTAKVAQAIAAETRSLGHETWLKDIAEIAPESVADYDLVFVGSACHDTDLAKPVQRFLEACAVSPALKLAGFVTHATYLPEHSDRARELYEGWAGNCIRTFHRVSEEKQIAFLGYFHCQGAPSPPIETFIHNTIVTDEDEWQSYIADVRRHPDEADLEHTRRFVRQVLAAY